MTSDTCSPCPNHSICRQLPVCLKGKTIMPAVAYSRRGLVKVNLWWQNRQDWKLGKHKLCSTHCESLGTKKTREGWGMLCSVQYSSVTQSCLTLCDPMNRSTPGLTVHHHLPRLTQTNVHRVSDAIQPSHPLSGPSPPAPNPSQHQSLFQWVNSSHEVVKVLEFQL